MPLARRGRADARASWSSIGSIRGTRSEFVRRCLAGGSRPPNPRTRTAVLLTPRLFGPVLTLRQGQVPEARRVGAQHRLLLARGPGLQPLLDHAQRARVAGGERADRPVGSDHQPVGAETVEG